MAAGIRHRTSWTLFAVRCAAVSLLSAAAALIVSGAATTAGARPPTAVAVIGSGAKRVVVRVDSRTLEPLRGSAHIRLPRRAVLDVSADSSRVAIADATRVVIADTASGRVIRRIRNEGFDVSRAVYWIGSAAIPLVVAVGESKFGYEYTTLPRGYASLDTDAAPAAALRGALVLSEGTALELFGEDESWLSLDRAPPGGATVVADVPGDRLFVVFRAGVVAEVQRDGRVAYHDVPLEGGAFEAVWARQGRIALWGADGLHVIDTRTWSTRSLAPTASGAAATPFGLVSWNAMAPGGVRVYTADGRRRLDVLAGMPVRAVVALGRYAYARVARTQYAIDLRTGRVRRVRSDATVVVPTLVSGRAS